jgi:HTH-type transcriptional regulator / antitoxin HigA
MSALAELDVRKYTRLASRVVLKAIETEEEYDRMVEAITELFDKGADRLSREERALLGTMSILVQAYDDQRRTMRRIPPNEMLQYLIEISGVETKELLSVFGTRGRLSEALSGKRSISKLQARKLADLFRVSAGLFI